MTPAACGTSWGPYKRHLRNGERCSKCLAYVASKQAAYRARKQAEVTR